MTYRSRGGLCGTGVPGRGAEGVQTLQERVFAVDPAVGQDGQGSGKQGTAENGEELGFREFIERAYSFPAFEGIWILASPFFVGAKLLVCNSSFGSYI